MKLRYLALGLALAGGTATLSLALTKNWYLEPVPPALAGVSDWSPNALPPTPAAPTGLNPLSDMAPGAWSAIARQTAPRLVPIPQVAPVVQPPLTIWSRALASGETLDALLREAGLNGQVRAEAALALGAEFDLRRLRPGNELSVITTPGGELRSVALGVENGVVIEAIFGDSTTTRTLNPNPQTRVMAGEAIIDSSMFEALEKANLPARFAVDLAQMLGGTVDFRRELRGGEKLQVLWREARLGDKRLGEPEITYAALTMGGSLYEVVWPDDGTGRATIYADGEVLRIFAQPVDGARLSSVYGQRRHPVYGNIRMHTGVDFAAARGTPVRATAPGRISYVGWRGGYGRVVEIAHGANTMTRYAHLGAVADGIAPGQRVDAGDMIGNVGSTGTATGPNLHYEVRVDGRPTDPMSDERLAAAAADENEDALADARLNDARARFETYLASAPSTETNERL